MPTMPGELLLVGIAQIAVVTAGFTAVTAALAHPRGSWSPGPRIRQRASGSSSFKVMFEALLPLIVFEWLADARAAVVLASAAVALWVTFVVVTRARQLLRAGGPRTRSAVVLFVAGPLACLLFAGNAVIVGSVALYALALCVQLSVAVISFYTLVAAASS
jgi:hypothetical protein